MKKSALFLLLTLSYLLPLKVRASDVSLVVSPPRTDLLVSPGEVVTKTIKVTNNGSSEVILDAQAIDFIVRDDLGTPIKVTENASGRFLASPWFTLDQNELTIPPKEFVQVTATIQVPKDALPGGHYSGVYFEPKARRGSKATVSYTSMQVGSLFGITVSGDISYDAVIRNFETKSYLSEFGPIEFTSTLQNQSDTHISPTTTIEIKDWIGRSLTTLSLDSLNIFPFASRTQVTKWNQVWGLGRYTAKLQVSYGPGLTTSRTIFFWILPWRLILALLVVILVIVAMTISIRRHILHRLDTRDSEIDELKRKIAELENKDR